MFRVTPDRRYPKRARVLRRAAQLRRGQIERTEVVQIGGYGRRTDLRGFVSSINHAAARVADPSTAPAVETR